MAKNKQDIKFEADIGGFKSAIKECEKAISSLNKELKLNSEQLKGDSQSVTLLQTRLTELQAKYKEQTDIVENTNKALETAKATYGENSEEARLWTNKLIDAKTAQQKIKNAIDETTEQLKKQSSGWINNGKALQETGKTLESVGKTMNSVGNKVSVISAGVAAGLAATAKAAIDYESAFTGVTKTVDGTEEQLKAINEGILEMSTRMPAAATEIAGVSEAAGQLGIKTDDILDFTEVMINLGESTNLGANEAASQIAKFANVTKMSSENYGRLGSVIVDLGNNFATTEADIVSMATRLASTAELTGLTQAQIMGLAAAMSSVGIEAEAGGSAMSKLLKKIQVAVETGGKDLTNFAKVAGVSTADFKKAFEKDAIGALSMFLAGLQDTEKNGKSAIAILDDMGITEVRLSNTVLSLSNAHDVLSSAVNTADKAWKENSALQNEANKRYATTESQIEMVKNEAKKLAIEFGRELLPSVKDLIKDAKPLLTNIANMVKSFSRLDDSTKKNIISFAGFVVAAGPVIKVIGSLTSGAGKVTSAIGKVSEKIGETTTQSSKLSSSASGASTALGILSISAVAVTTAIGVAKAQLAEENAEFYRLRDEIEDTIASRKALNESTQDSVNKTLSEINRIETLKSKLSEIVDANGKVKEGYEKRASYIVNELKNATGIEIELVGDTIKEYGKLESKIEDVIATKKTEAIYNALEKRFGDSSANLEKYKKQLEEAKIKESELWSAYDKSLKTWNPIEAIKTTDRMKDAQEASQKVRDMQNTVNEAMDDIARYNYATDLMAEGSKAAMDELYNTYVYGTADISDASEANIAKTLDNISSSMEYYSQKTDEASNKAYNEQQNMLNSTAETLSNMTATVNDLSPNLISAWTTLAQTSTDSYAQALSSLPPETIHKIQEATGYVISDEQLANAFTKLGKDGITGFSSNDFKGAGVEAAEDIKKGTEQKKSTLFNTGQSMGSSIVRGIKSVFNASTISAIGSGSGIKSSNADGLAYVPYNGYVARLHEGERVLTKEQNADYMANHINNNNNNSFTINFYAQSITDADMARVSNYIERKWGRKS